MITRTRAFEFRALHRLPVGPRPEGLHGHRYRIEITTRDAPPDAVDAAVFPLVESLHGRVLDVAPATGEVLVEWIDRALRETPLGPQLRAVVLRETAKNSYVSAASEARHV